MPYDPVADWASRWQVPPGSVLTNPDDDRFAALAAMLEREGFGVRPPPPSMFPPVPLMERPQPQPQGQGARIYYGGAAERAPDIDLRTLLPGFSAGQDLARGVAERDPTALGIGAAGLFPWGRPNAEWLRRMLGRERALPAPATPPAPGPSVPGTPVARDYTDVFTPAGSVEARMRIMDWTPPGRVPRGNAPAASYFEQLDALRWYLRERGVPDAMPWGGDPQRLARFLEEAVTAYRAAGPNAYGRSRGSALTWHQGGGTIDQPPPPPPRQPWSAPRAEDITISRDVRGRAHRPSGHFATNREAADFERLLADLQRQVRGE
jgi:hypothetical protein